MNALYLNRRQTETLDLAREHSWFAKVPHAGRNGCFEMAAKPTRSCRIAVLARFRMIANLPGLLSHY
jgi:hypothetical protein